MDKDYFKMNETLIKEESIKQESPDTQQFCKCEEEDSIPILQLNGDVTNVVESMKHENFEEDDSMEQMEPLEGKYFCKEVRYTLH